MVRKGANTSNCFVKPNLFSKNVTPNTLTEYFMSIMWYLMHIFFIGVIIDLFVEPKAFTFRIYILCLEWSPKERFGSTHIFTEWMCFWIRVNLYENYFLVFNVDKGWNSVFPPPNWLFHNVNLDYTSVLAFKKN